MPNVGGNFLAGVQGGNIIQERRRKNKMAEIMAGAYEDPVSGTIQQVPNDAQGDEMVDVVRGGRPGGLNFQNAIAGLYKAGFGPEAMALEQQRETSSVNNLLHRAQAHKALQGDNEWDEPKAGVINGKEAFVQVNKRTGQVRPVTGVTPRPQQPLVNLDMKGDEAFAKEIAKKQADMYSTAEEAAGISGSLLDVVQRMKGILPNIRTGTGAGTEAAVGSGMKALGMGPTNWGLMDPAKAEEFQAGASQSVGMIRQVLKFPASGFSDADRLMLENAMAGLNKNPAANLAILDAAEKVAQRSQERLVAMDKWLGTHKNLNGFNAEWTEYNRKNPLFKAKPKPSAAPQKGSYKLGDVVESGGKRYRVVGLSPDGNHDLAPVE